MHTRTLGGLALLGCLTSACGPTPTPCDVSCGGCCDARGLCQSGFFGTACGVGGTVCASCSNGDSCQAGVCRPVVGGSGGSGTAGGGGGPGGGMTGGGGGRVDPVTSLCAGSMISCNGHCIDPGTDESHCGACGHG